MIIQINCPVCRANNAVDPTDFQCRRCREDLSLLYNIKGYSLKYRQYALRALINKSEQQLTFALLQMARQLDKT